MLSIISPAKTQDFTLNKQNLLHTKPYFAQKSQYILELCKKLSKDEIMHLMGISDKLAEINNIRFQNFEKNSSKQALFAYDGDVYSNIDRENFTKKNIEFLQEHLLIVSGLYGLLKPFDGIRPYRLEMAVKLPTIGKLSSFWQDDITEYVNEKLITHKNKYLINLASSEYACTVNRDKLKYPIINIHFKENKNNKLQVIGINAKKARGAMVDFIGKNFVDQPEELKKFNLLNYKYNNDLSFKTDWVFTRTA